MARLSCRNASHTSTQLTQIHLVRNDCCSPSFALRPYRRLGLGMSLPAHSFWCLTLDSWFRACEATIRCLIVESEGDGSQHECLAAFRFERARIPCRVEVLRVPQLGVHSKGLREVIGLHLTSAILQNSGQHPPKMGELCGPGGPTTPLVHTVRIHGQHVSSCCVPKKHKHNKLGSADQDPLRKN